MNILQEPGTENKSERTLSKRYVFTGLILLIFGALLIADRLTEGFNVYISWELILIVVGIYVGEKHNFKGIAWIILILVGGFFLLDDFIPDLKIRYFVGPVALIVVGAYLILRPQKAKYWRQKVTNAFQDENTTNTTAAGTSDDYIDSVSIFGGMNKNIMNKSFKGGEAVSIFGGTEINLTQADIQGTVVLELTQIMGGCKLVIPPHWDLKTELVNIFGGVEDKRPFQNVVIDHTKLLVLKGTSIFGGIEIRSY